MPDFTSLTWELGANISGVLLAVVAVLGIIWNWGGKFLRWTMQTFSKMKTQSNVEFELPKRSVILVQKPQQSWWHMGKRKDLPIMQIVTRWHATNITKRQVRLLSARLLKPKTKDDGSHSPVSVRHPDSNIYGSYPILPGATVPCSVSFYVGPPTRKPGESLTVAFEVVDQYGNVHNIDEIDLKYS